MLIKYGEDTLHGQSLFKDNRSEGKGKRGRLLFSPWRRTPGILSKRGSDRFLYCTGQDTTYLPWASSLLDTSRADKRLSGSRLSFP